MHETELAPFASKPVAAIRGFDGVADEKTRERIPTVRFIDC